MLMISPLDSYQFRCKTKGEMVALIYARMIELDRMGNTTGAGPSGNTTGAEPAGEPSIIPESDPRPYFVSCLIPFPFL